jgi:hypothetical protein
MSDRKARKKLTKKVDITKPIMPFDIDKFGTEEDPCFGKLHDLTADECKRCGDCTICQIVYNQGTLIDRAKEESNGRFKDLELGESKPDKKAIKKFIKSKLKDKVLSIKIKKQVVTKFGITKEEASKLIKKLK